MAHAEQEKSVLCNSDPEASETVNRVLCLLGARPGCGICPNKGFNIRFQFRIVDQAVMCPRWASEEQRLARADTVEYVAVSRTTCLGEKPFLQCVDCPNGVATERPRTVDKWWDLEQKARRLELDLDDEEKDVRNERTSQPHRTF